ncbi:CDP-alcohol phosphatidyltransferase family protein [Dyella jejuensis]
MRVALVAPICGILLQRNWPAALTLVAVAGISDGVDGFLARRYGWQSRLGGMLDAVADKLLLISCFVILAWLRETPIWLALVVCGRDLVIASGALLWRLLIGRIDPQQSLLSKACTLMQIAYLLAVLLTLAQWPSPPAPAFIWPVAGLCVASGLDYVLRWSRRAWHARRTS